MHKPLLILMCRWPAPNRCKTRLAKEIGACRAAEIQKRLTKHTIAVAKKLSENNLIEVKLAIDGIGMNRIKRWSQKEGISQAVRQGEGNLGLKMKRQIVLAQKKRKKPNRDWGRDTVLIGTDVPSLCEEDISLAINSLTHNELVIGPAKDGGYWLIGFSKKILYPGISWPFTGINWGTNSVFKETIKRAKEKGISYQLVNHKNDLDQAIDLREWHT